jgi:hypothetical protein
MQQFCTYGSVRGAPGNRRPYRDKTEIRGDFPVAIEFSAGGEVEYGDPEAIY